MAEDNWTPEKEAAARQNAAGLNSYLTNLTGFGAGGSSRAALENAGNNISRNLGIDPTARKPDGTTITGLQNKSVAFGQGLLERNDVETRKLNIFANFSTANRTTLETKDDNKAVKQILKAGKSTSVRPIVANPLEKFASYNVLWTLATLTPQQYNNPALYRTSVDQLNNIIFSSAGRFPEKRVSTAFGTPEYYINNFTMRCVVGSNEQSGNQNAIGFSFDIYEPYSMGLLLQSVQRSARLAGYENYLDNAVYVLRMDFQGFDELGNVYKNISPKFFTIKITKITFQVNEGGSVYKVTAVPYNHQAYADMTNTTYKDCRIGGDAGGPGTVIETLVTGKRSLVKFLNDNEKTLLKEKLIGLPDVYDIQFPEQSNIFYSNTVKAVTENRATQDPKKETKTVQTTSKAIDTIQVTGDASIIGLSSLGFNETQGGTVGFKRGNEVYDQQKGIKQVDNMIFNPKERSMQFTQSTSITSIITQVILSSKWAHETIKKRTSQGFIQWFKVDVQMELLQFDDIVGDYAKKFVFRVVPYYIHESIFSEASQKPIGYNELMKVINKEYNYIYTGQNIDILKFDIEINNLFYKGAEAAPKNQNAKADNPEQQGVAANPQNKVERKEGSAKEENQEKNVGRARKKRDVEALKKSAGGSGYRSTEQEVAEEFQRAFLSGGSADLIRVNLEILGDTYWIVDSGYSNYFSPARPDSQITEDGAMNYESGDVYIYIAFRTPADVNETTGLYDFNGKIQESPFGGIYRVVTVESSFVDGVWKQKLSCLRMPGPQDTEGQTGTVAQAAEQSGYADAGKEPEAARVGDSVVNGETPPQNVQIGIVNAPTYIA